MSICPYVPNVPNDSVIHGKKVWKFAQFPHSSLTESFYMDIRTYGHTDNKRVFLRRFTSMVIMSLAIVL